MRKTFASLVALAALLISPVAWADQLTINAQTGTTYTFLNTDCGKLVTFNNSAAQSVTLPQASSPSGGGSGSGLFMPPCTIDVLDLGTGTVTITPTVSTINSAASILMNNTGAGTKRQSIRIVSDGANYEVPNGISYWTTP